MMKEILKRSKKKITYSLLCAIFICSLILAGCGVKEDKLVENESQVVEVSKTEIASTVELPEETVVEETLIEEPEEVVSVEWYIDEVGLKNDQLGVIVKKDNSLLEELRVCTTLSIEGKKLDFYCSYNDSNLDEYILQRPEMKKGKIGNVEYAYDTQNIVFVGNGIKISSNYFFWGLDEGTNIEEWIEENDIVTPIDGLAMNCLAYNSKDGLYCPALGIAVYKNGAASVGAQYYYETDNYGYTEVNFKDCIDSAVTGSAHNAQEAVENYKKYFSEYDLKLIDGSIEVDLGDDYLVGVGFDREDMCFSDLYPDNLEYCISLNFSDIQTCEEALNCIEKLN